MPTSIQEADHIVGIVLDNVSPEKAYHMLNRMWIEVGQHTDNASLKESLYMLRHNLLGSPTHREAYVRDAASASIQPVSLRDQLSLSILVALHAALVIQNAVSIVLLPFFADAIVAVPLITFIVWLSTSRVADCPLTRMENNIRRRMGKPEIGGFIGYYFIKPIYRAALRLLPHLRKRNYDSQIAAQSAVE